MAEPVITVARAVAVLNRLIEIDQNTAQELFDFGVDSNVALALDPEFFVSASQMGMGVLGLINSMFGETDHGLGAITAAYDDETGKLHHFIDSKDSDRKSSDRLI